MINKISITNSFKVNLKLTDVIHRVRQFSSGANISSLKVLNEDFFVKKELYKPLIEGENSAFHRELKIIKNNNLKGLKLTERLNSKEKIHLIKLLTSVGNFENFVLFATGNKPSVSIAGNISKNLSRQKGVDVVKYNHDLYGEHVKLTVLMNPKRVKAVIFENLELYQKRLNLGKNSSVDEIYDFFKKDSNICKLSLTHGDIFGLTLGFPKINSLFFQLKTVAGSLDGIKPLILSKKCPYKNISGNLQKELLGKTDKIVKKTASEYFNLKEHEAAYMFNAYVEEPESFGKILDEIRCCIKALSKINNQALKG